MEAVFLMLKLCLWNVRTELADQPTRRLRDPFYLLHGVLKQIPEDIWRMKYLNKILNDGEGA